MDNDAAKYRTLRHIERLRNLLNVFVKELLGRGETHDQCKMETPEVEAFAAKVENLAGTTYGSAEYKKDIAVALQHHDSRHHPEHFRNGIRDMNLLDVVEMFCDWKASSELHNDGNLRKSIEHNSVRFNMGPELTRIFENTIEVVE